MERLKNQIYKYCVKITLKKWDAEDLSQDVWLKVLKIYESNPAIVMSNAYLYRIALNTWIDKCKKDSKVMVDESMLERGEQDQQLVTHELLEELADRLSPRAMVIILLMDVFDFTAKETADFIGATEGSVQVAIGRARKRLNRLAHQIAVDPLMIKKPNRYNKEGNTDFNISTLADAIRKRDPKAICRTYFGLSKQNIRIRQIHKVSGKLLFTFTDLDGNRFQISS
jgi:RNA polymerase sigma factor (sigma-70 family)